LASAISSDFYLTPGGMPPGFHHTFAMSQPAIHLQATHKRLVYAVFALAWTSGVLWLLFHYFVIRQGAFGPESHPLEAWWLRLHGFASMLALVVLGSLAVNHMRHALHHRKSLSSGLSMLMLAVWLAATGYALYYFSSDDNAAWLPLLHWIPGLAVPVLLSVHVFASRVCLPRGRIRLRHRHDSHAGGAEMRQRFRSQSGINR
jgi:hypothetical protein